MGDHLNEAGKHTAGGSRKQVVANRQIMNTFQDFHLEPRTAPKQIENAYRGRAASFIPAGKKERCPFTDDLTGKGLQVPDVPATEPAPGGHAFRPAAQPQDRKDPPKHLGQRIELRRLLDHLSLLREIERRTEKFRFDAFTPEQPQVRLRRIDQGLKTGLIAIFEPPQPLSRFPFPLGS
jgi:hypothetical protein